MSKKGLVYFNSTLAGLIAETDESKELYPEIWNKKQQLFNYF
ncbi:hypothetical protein [Pelobium manganitolerans]|nr:hypothetical protein [Pelobium manganitolerans]